MVKLIKLYNKPHSVPEPQENFVQHPVSWQASNLGKYLGDEHLERLIHLLCQLPDKWERRRVPTEVDLICRYALQCARPCPAPLVIPNLLRSDKAVSGTLTLARLL